MTPPLALAAPGVSWTRDVDVVVIGSGAAGLAAALAMRPLRSVLLVTKDTLDAGSTAWAQGGLAAVLDPQDTLEAHVADTLAAEVSIRVGARGRGQLVIAFSGPEQFQGLLERLGLGETDQAD